MSADEVYLDTSALFPLLDEEDEDNGRVTEALQRIKAQSRSIVTSSYTIVESGALARSRVGMSAFRDVGAIADELELIVWVDESG